MKFLAMCSTGLGSSFMVRMNIEEVLGELGVSGVEVDHSDIGSASPASADVFFVAKDLAETAEGLGDVVVLNSIIDREELREAVKDAAVRKGLL
ncbi:PTS sugar transporter subunit IIB [Streptomyces mayteni]